MRHARLRRHSIRWPEGRRRHRRAPTGCARSQEDEMGKRGGCSPARTRHGEVGSSRGHNGCVCAAALAAGSAPAGLGRVKAQRMQRPCAPSEPSTRRASHAQARLQRRLPQEPRRHRVQPRRRAWRSGTDRHLQARERAANWASYGATAVCTARTYTSGVHPVAQNVPRAHTRERKGLPTVLHAYHTAAASSTDASGAASPPRCRAGPACVGPQQDDPPVATPALSLSAVRMLSA